LFNIECCVPLNFACIEKKIYWFSFICTMVNCSVWLECCTWRTWRTFLPNFIPIHPSWNGGSSGHKNKKNKNITEH